ncbi:cell wall-binding repeat-containing protein [Microaceticoccus formicicus]|uniref:cell wall-binding repeat-containing protein n=1 Tax=Microaceticoccus formicicus TaxID=3118105 RepID=UPI003CCFFAE1|nr:cell wall-binding repeat-containing protein [Peptoniphilaceae bacterium AMB_02]
MKKRILGFLLALFIFIPSLVVSADSISLVRISGSDRYQTAIEVGKKEFGTADYAIIASGENFADALVGGTLAVQTKSPLYLTKKDSLPENLLSELKRLNPSEVYLLGGLESVSEKVEKEIAADLKVTRVSGPNREKTAEKVVELRYIINKGTKDAFKSDSKLTEFIVNGYVYPDAISAAPLVGKLVGKDVFTALYLADNIKYYPEAYIIGGENTVEGESPNRISGTNRYLTSLEVAKEYAKHFEFDTVIVVNGDDYPDALSASGLSGKYNAPILLTSKNNTQSEVLKYIKNKANKVIIVGGTNSVSELVAEKILYSDDSNYNYAAKSLLTNDGKSTRTELTGNEVEDILGLFLNKLKMVELADTFTKEKAADILNGENLPATMSDLALKRAAALVSVTSIEPVDITNLVSEDKNHARTSIDRIVTAVNEFFSEEVSFTGSTSDNQIFTKLENALNSTKLLIGNEIFPVGVKMVSDDLTTGFNVKQKQDIGFNPELSIVYGHSDINHAKQLIGLLRSENIEAKLHLETKTSAFKYMLEWGPIPEPSDSYEVVKISEDLYIANAREYDLNIEFSNAEDKAKFDELINKYAKKSSSNPDGKGLLTGSWWQPLYWSNTEITKGYQEIIDNSANAGDYVFHSFTKTEDSEKLIDALNKFELNMVIEANKIWVNDAFIRYLNGQSE